MARHGRGFPGGRARGARHAAALLAAACRAGHRGVRLAVADRAGAEERAVARLGLGHRPFRRRLLLDRRSLLRAARRLRAGSACPSWRPSRCSRSSSRALRLGSHAGWSSVGRRWAGAIAAWSCWRSPGPRPNGCAATCFTGYLWNPLGHVWAFAAPLLQGAALFGVYGLGTLTFLILAAPTAGWRASIAALVAVGHRGLRRPEHDGSGDRRRTVDAHRAAQCRTSREVAA